MPGHELFRYLDEHANLCVIDSSDVNAYLREITQQEFTAKDFRTWAGTLLAVRELKALAEFDSTAEAKRNVAKAIAAVAKRLGNTRAICRKCFIHPEIVNCYLDGALARSSIQSDSGKSIDCYSVDEAILLSLLERRLENNGGENRVNRPVNCADLVRTTGKL